MRTIVLTEEQLKMYTEALDVLSEDLGEMGFGVIRYGNRGRGNTASYHTIWDRSDQNGNVTADLMKISDPVLRREVFDKLRKGEISMRDLSQYGIGINDNGIDLDTRTKINRGEKDRYTTGTYNDRYNVLTFIKANYPTIQKLKRNNNFAFYLKQITNIMNMGYENIIMSKSNLLPICNNCLKMVAKASGSEVVEISEKRARNGKPEYRERPSDLLIKVAYLLTHDFGDKSISEINGIIDYFTAEFSKNAEYSLNRQKLLNSNDTDLSYYKSVVPGTSTNVITLFPFKDFGGTELLKADRLSLYNDNMRGIYGAKDKGEKYVSSKFDERSREDFLTYSIKHAWDVLTYEKFMPNFIICVPSTAPFNKDFINKLSGASPCGSKHYDVFVEKEWLDLKVDKQTEEKIKQYLGYLEYSGGTKYTSSVEGMMKLLRRGVANTLLHTISSVLNEKLFVKNHALSDSQRGQFVKYFIYKLSAERKVYDQLFQTGKKDFNMKVPVEHMLDEKLEGIIMAALREKLERFINGNQPLRVEINEISYKPTGQQMTTLLPTGAVHKGAINGQLLRPLVADVYAVNRKEYELTVEGRTMINEMKENMASQQKEKVEMAHQSILIFDDDIDTGSSLKLTVDALNKVLREAKITNTYLECLTLFGKTGKNSVSTSKNKK